MISFRHHLVSIIAVFVALAVGVVLGGGPLSELGRDDEPEQAAPQERDDSDLQVAFGDSFAQAAAAPLLGTRLEGQQVALVTLPGAPADVVDGVVAQVEAGGGQISGRFDGRSALVTPGEQNLVNSLGTQLVTDLDLADELSPELGSHERIGRLIGLAVASTEPEGEEPDAAAGTVLEALQSADLLTADDAVAGRAPLVLVVMGEDRDDPDSTALVAGLARGLAVTSIGTVVVGSTTSGEDGDLSVLRQEDLGTATTVDGDETTVGQVSAALALANALSGENGAFGASGADGTVPLG